MDVNLKTAHSKLSKPLRPRTKESWVSSCRVKWKQSFGQCYCYSEDSLTHRKEKAFTFNGFPYKRRAGMSAFPSVFLQLFVVNVCLDSQNLQPAIKRRQCKHQIFAFFFIWHCDFVSHISFCVLTRFLLKKVFKSCCKYCRVLHGSFFVI